jgi:hypothetical protein
MNEEMLTKPLELDESALYAVAGGSHAGFHQILPDIRTNVEVNIIFVEIGNGNRVTAGSGNGRGPDNGSGSVGIADGNEVIIYA